MPDAPIRLLVVDDDADVRRLLVRLLGQEGYEVCDVGAAAEVPSAIDRTQPHLVLLDVMMPDVDGLDVLAQIRTRSAVPVIFLSARGLEADRILGLRSGADDYIVKPFSPGELVARIESVLRRAGAVLADGGEDLSFGTVSIDTATREVHVSGAFVATTAREFDLLVFFASSPRQVFSREQLLRQVWDSSSEWQDPATVTEHIRRLRRKIEADPDNPRHLLTVRGVGYRLEP